MITLNELRNEREDFEKGIQKGCDCEDCCNKQDITKALSKGIEVAENQEKRVLEIIDTVININSRSFCNEIELEWIRTKLKERFNSQQTKSLDKCSDDEVATIQNTVLGASKYNKSIVDNGINTADNHIQREKEFMTKLSEEILRRKGIPFVYLEGINDLVDKLAKEYSIGGTE